MKHNQHNTGFNFLHDPLEFNKWTDKSVLQYCLGGTLYMPATRLIVDKLLNRQLPALKSMVMCFEDAIRADEIEVAQENVLQQLDQMVRALDKNAISENDIPLIFLRVRNPEQFKNFSVRLNGEQARVLSGFVFPKYSSESAIVYLNQLEGLNQLLDTRLYGMPILEGKEIAYKETRLEELNRLKVLMDPFKSLILNIRVGGTDFSSFFGVRRAINASIYDILPVRDILSDILNVFNRADSGYTLSGPVWEYFLAYKQDDLSHLLEQNLNRSLLTLQPILNDAIDGLLREVLLDKANGFVGKTVIHPSHLTYVNAMQAVTLEEYDDARQIMNVGDGVIKSEKNNKMNEANPHRNWAHQVLARADAYGVIENENDFVQLFVDSAELEK